MTISRQNSLQAPMEAVAGYRLTAAALRLFGQNAYPKYTFQGVYYALTEDAQTYRCTIDYVTYPKAKPRLISIFEGFADSMRFLIGSIVFFESLQDTTISSQNLLYNAMAYMTDRSNPPITSLPTGLPDDLQRIIREIKTEHYELHHHLASSSPCRDNRAEGHAKKLHALSVDLKKQLAAYVGEKTQNLQKKVEEKQQIAQIYGGIHCAFSTFIAPDQETVEYCFNPYDKASNNPSDKTGSRPQMKITARSPQPKLSKEFIRQVKGFKAPKRDVTTESILEDGDANSIRGSNRYSLMTVDQDQSQDYRSSHFGAGLYDVAKESRGLEVGTEERAVHEGIDSPLLTGNLLSDSLDSDDPSSDTNSEVIGESHVEQAVSDERERLLSETGQKKRSLQCFMTNFNQAHEERIIEVAAPTEPYDAATGNVRNLTHNVLLVEARQDNRESWSEVSRDSFSTMGTVDLFQLVMADTTATMKERLEKAKRIIREALKTQLQERLDNFKQLYQPLIENSQKPVKFYLDYMTLLSPCLADSLHAIVDCNQEFVDIAQQAMKNLEEEFYCTANKNPAKAAKKLGLKATDLYKIELVFTHSNTPANDLLDEAGSTEGGNKRYVQQLMTQRNVVDDPFNQQTRDKKKAWVEILENQSFFNFNYKVRVKKGRSSSQEQQISLKQLFENVIKFIQGKASSPAEIITAINSMEMLEQLLNNPDNSVLNESYRGGENSLALCQEIAFRLKATVELCLSEQRIYRHAPEYFAKDYNYYHARAALESCCMGQAAVKLDGCKSGRDRTAFVSAAIRAYHICGESSGKIFQQTVDRELNSGHEARRLLPGQSQRVKIDDVAASNASRVDENNQEVHPGIVDAIPAKKNVRGTKSGKASSDGVGAKIWSGVKAVATGFAGAVVGVVALPLLTDFLKPSMSSMLGYEGKAFRFGFAVSRLTCYLPVIALVALYSYIDKKIFWPDRKQYIEEQNKHKQDGINEADRVPYRARAHALLTPLVNNLLFFREEQPAHKAPQELEKSKAEFLAGAAMDENRLIEADTRYQSRISQKYHSSHRSITVMLEHEDAGNRKSAPVKLGENSGKANGEESVNGRERPKSFSSLLSLLFKSKGESSKQKNQGSQTKFVRS